MEKKNYSPMTKEEVVNYLFQMLEGVDNDLQVLNARDLSSHDKFMIIAHEEHRDFILSVLDLLNA